MILMTGKEVAEAIKPTTKTSLSLAIVFASNNSASKTYANSLIKLAEKLDIPTKLVELDENVTYDEVAECLKSLSNDETVGNILPLMPFPKHINKNVLGYLAPEKDLDNLLGINLWKDYFDNLGGTPQACIYTLKHYGIELTGKHVVVIGRSNVVGLPLANYLILNDATVTVCHTKTRDLSSFTKQADIIISAAGKAGIVTKDMVKDGVVIVDVGINFKDGKICGDVDADVMEKASAFTPVPNGIGVVSNMAIMKKHRKLCSWNG